MSPLQQLEAYSQQHPQEVLLISARWLDGANTEQEDYVMVFKGVSSSLMHATAVDADVPVLPPQAEILTIDRLASPYNPNQPQYLEQNITWERFVAQYLNI
ncbi:hypothetical protein RIF25_09730 [Thermosynechococcaceae cyanobacterium BACA0444]|uniref:DUF7734 domain-containing protein n=1 Tax=Pseudocalidococcus azoricus BACA0444 TaxID=2918990 RepID=A0AAE4FTJ3_9CYAN|nr:hypothetical protein [Pseudocalidococcus azoricus]MDS3861084.1 hypothetical protein [Pseudocalidococcus azoricus BACA0444]